MFFPSPSTWKMVKDAPNHVPMKIIGLSQTSREILEDSDVPIFPVVISTLGSLQSSLNHYCDCTGIPLSTFCTEVNTICIWLYVQCQRATDKSDETFLQKIMSSCSSLEVFLLTSQTHKKWNPISPWIFPLFGGDGYAMMFIILWWLPQKNLPPKKIIPHQCYLNWNIW